MDAADDLALHLRLLAGDADAGQECARRWIVELRRRLRSSFPGIVAEDEHVIEAAVEDALLNYIEKPERFDTELGTLANYLFYSAKGDLLNAWRRESRRRSKVVSIEANKNVELSLVDGNDLEESITTDRDAAAILPRVLLAFPAQQDRDFIALIIAGERHTAAFAALLGIKDKPESEQRKIIYRHKDRIMKRLSRIRSKE